MKNEPVAWTDGKGNYFDKNSFFPVDDLIPLYTHPANKKVEKNTDLYEKVCNCTKKLDLTDDEIIEIWCVMETDTGEQNIAFARAILRKAQEK